MALQHLRSNTASKRPTPGSMSDGQLAINTNATTPGLFFKDADGALVKVGPVFVGTSAPNSTPAGSTGNALGEQWLDTSGGGYVLKIWDGSAWRSEAGEFVDAAGDTMTGDLVMDNANIVFEGSTDDGFETTLTVTDPTADRTITLPNVTGTVVTTGDTGSVTSTMIADGTIVNADINASAAIAASKIVSGSTSGAGVLQLSDSTTSTSTTLAATANAVKVTKDVADAALPKAGGTVTGELLIGTTGSFVFEGATDNDFETTLAVADPTADRTITLPNVTGTVVTTGDTGTVTSTMITDGTIVNADVNASAAIAGTKIDPDFGSQTIETTGVVNAGSGTAGAPSVSVGTIDNGLYSPGTDQVAISTSSSERIRIGANGEIGLSGANYGTNGQVLTSAGSGAAPTWQTSAAGAGDKIEEGNTSVEVIDTGSDGRVVFTTEGNEVGRFDSSGRLGVGTSSPSNTLHVVGTGRFNVSGANNAVLASDGGDPFFYTEQAARLKFGTSSAVRITIDSNGKVGVGQSSPATDIDLLGNYSSNVTTVSTLTINCSQGNYFLKTINANSTFIFNNVPSFRAFSFTLELTHNSGTVTWPSSVKWPDDTAPTLTTGKTHLFIFVTYNGGTRFRGASLVDYVN